MPWQETHPMDQRLQFVADHQRGLYAMTTLCARYGVSRKTGYHWLARYGSRAMRPRARAGCTRGATPRPVARTRSTGRWPRSCSRRGASIRRGGRRSSCSTSRPGIRPSSAGRR